MLVFRSPGHKGLSERVWTMRYRGLGGAVAALALASASGTEAGAAPSVATDILPVQSIVAAVMAGVGEPAVILPPGASPHEYSLRPSEAGLLSRADLVVWVGPDLTPWLADPLDSLAPGAVKLALKDAPGVETLPIRLDGPFEADEDDTEHAHEPGEHHDGHLWLDPANAAAAARDVAGALGRLDPANAATYTANAEAFAGQMTTLTAEVRAEVAPLRGKPFLVFHDAYQYFEHAFRLPAAGSVALQDGVEPGPARVAAIRQRAVEGEIVCAFAEPEFSPKLLATITEGTSLRTGTLDHLGAGIAPGPGLYPAVIRGLAHDLGACLAPQG